LAVGNPHFEHVRIFIALDIDDGIRERIQTFMEGVRGFAPDAGWVRAESLHVTLKFAGEKPPETVETIKNALRDVDVGPFSLALRGHGFFPSPKAPRVFWVGIDAGTQLTALVAAIDDAAHALGIPREDHPFSPHLTLARRRGGSAAPRWGKGDKEHSGFQRLQEKLAALPTPEFGTMTAHEFFLYESQLSRGGARYTKLERFVLREARSPRSPQREL
jgi:RNA 2',3'-cyclic 3'-phosphodiesterase